RPGEGGSEAAAGKGSGGGGAGKRKGSEGGRRLASPRRVRFADGPLGGAADGHPAAEGRGGPLRPVRELGGGAVRGGGSVSKRDVRELERPELLGNEEYEHSLKKLRVRVGLLPAAPPARPFASKLKAVEVPGVGKLRRHASRAAASAPVDA
ncbi:hypothetical protein TSOC_004347, partial [Tetrabaena socialis]